MAPSSIKPRRLDQGARIGLVSTSFPVGKEVVDKSLIYLQGLGFQVKVGDHTLDRSGFLSGSAADRVTDIVAMFEDDEVSAIFVAGGGRNASHLVDRLDYNVIRNHPKIFMALSNPTVIANAISARTSLITFHGPTGYNFGEQGVTSFTEASMLRALTDPTPLGDLAFTSRPETLRGSSSVTGRLFGGHLLTTRALLGSRYQPDWRTAVLMVEDCFEELHDFDDHLSHFRLAGVFDKIRALLVGRPVDVEERMFETNETMQDVVLRICAGYTFPILYGFEFGHTEDKTVLPIGAELEVDPLAGTIRVGEPVVS